MTERELMIECIPQITEMVLEIKKMTPEQYQAIVEAAENAGHIMD